MGWNSWNHFGCNVSDALLRGAFDYLLRRALTPAGPYTNLFPVGAATFVDTNVANGKTYYYQISATA